MSDAGRDGTSEVGAAPSLADFDATLSLAKRAYQRRVKAAQLELLRMQNRMRDDAPCSLAVVFEGVDAAGKGGAIRRLTGRLDPRGLRVYPVGAPSAEEQRRHYLWRFHLRMPRAGRIAIFDRSWYGRVLVERVEGLASRERWERAYDEIVAFEGAYAAEGTAIAKFWLQITPEEQLRRFEARAADPFKEYKLTDEDWRNRERWGDYRDAAEEMLRRTHSAAAPWTLVSAEDKYHARAEVLETVVERLRSQLDG